MFSRTLRVLPVIKILTDGAHTIKGFTRSLTNYLLNKKFKNSSIFIICKQIKEILYKTYKNISNNFE